MARYLFLSNWERTETWLAAGAELVRRGHQVFFCVTRREHLRKALRAGFARETLLWLNRQDARRAEIGPELRRRLQALEEEAGVRVRAFTLMDRFMRSERSEWADRYSHYVFDRLERFVEDKAIDIAVGQPDNIPDLLAEALVKRRKGGLYAAPFEFRLPRRRFVLWDGMLERRPHLTGVPSPAEVPDDLIEEARALRDEVRRGARMHQVLAKSAAPSIGLSFLRRLLRGALYRALIVSRHDVYMYRLRSVLFDLKYHMTPFNGRRLGLPWNRVFEHPVEGESYVFYALNYAPEHTVDVEAAHFTNTFETVRSIAMSLPLGVRLYVKEHPTALGIRGPRELRRLKRLPGVRLIDPAVDSHALIREALLTVSLAGTVSLEAALYGRSAVVISDIFIQDFSTCRRLGAPWEVGGVLSEAPPVADEEADLRTLAWLLSNSHPGTVIEPIVDPDSLSAPNIALVADAFESLAALAPGPDSRLC